MLAHAASGANWVLSTIMVQQWVEDELRGRVFSADMLVLSVAFSISSSLAGLIVEREWLTIQSGIMAYAIVMVCSGMVFTLWRPDLEAS